MTIRKDATIISLAIVGIAAGVAAIGLGSDLFVRREAGTAVGVQSLPILSNEVAALEPRSPLQWEWIHGATRRYNFLVSGTATPIAVKRFATSHQLDFTEVVGGPREIENRRIAGMLAGRSNIVCDFGPDDARGFGTMPSGTHISLDFRYRDSKFTVWFWR